MKVTQQYKNKQTGRIAVIEELIPRKPKGFSVTYRYIGDMYPLQIGKARFLKEHTKCQ